MVVYPKYCARPFSDTEVFLEKYLLSSLTLLGILGNVVFYVCTFKLKRKPHFYVYIYYLLTCDISATINFFVWPIMYLLWETPGCYQCPGKLNGNQGMKLFQSDGYARRLNNHSFFSKSYFVYVAKYHWYFEEILSANANWMTAFIGFDRVFALYRPLLYGRFFTKRKILIFCLAFTLVNAMFSVPYSLILRFDELKMPSKKKNSNTFVSIRSNSNDSWISRCNKTSSQKADAFNATYYMLEQMVKEWTTVYDQFYVGLMYLIPLCLSLTCNCIIIKKIYVRRIKVFPALFNSKRRRLASSARWDMIRKVVTKGDIPNSGMNKPHKMLTSITIAWPTMLIEKCKSIIITTLTPITSNREYSANVSIVNVVKSLELPRSDPRHYARNSPCPSFSLHDRLRKMVGIIAPIPTINTNRVDGAGDRLYNVVNAYSCRKMIRRKFNQYSKQAAIKTSILIMAQSFQIFVFNLPFIIFVFWEGYAWNYSFEESVYNKQVLVHLFKQLNPLLGVYINLIFDNNIRDIYCKWFVRICKKKSENMKT
ncbi:unnamed protein product [Gordionus sp. m RMFG-2023]